MKHLFLGLVAVAATVFGLAATGSAENWGHLQREERCPAVAKPNCGYDGHAACTASGWLCEESGGGRQSGGGSGYGQPRQSGENCLQTYAPPCVAGYLPRCSAGHWRCVP